MLLLAQGVMAQTTTGEVEVVGAIEALGTNTLTVNGLLVDISSAEINTALQLDLTVKVEGVLASDGTITARQVNAVDQGILPDEAEFVGVVDRFDGNTLVVGGIAFDVSGAEISGDIAVGATVKVHARLLEDGTWTAREVETEDNTPEAEATAEPEQNDQAGEFEITGTLESVGDGFIVVSGQTISIAGAEIKDMLVPGALVKIHLSLIDGQLVAREVENARENDDHQDDGVFDCSLPSGWTTYTVQGDDILSGIAARTDSSVEELAAANCLANPGMIVTGSTVFVPEAPSFDSSHDSGDDHGGSISDDNSGHDSGDDHGNDSNDDHGDDNSGSNSGHGGGGDD